MAETKPCPMCGSENITAFGEQVGDNHQCQPVTRGYAGCPECGLCIEEYFVSGDDERFDGSQDPEDDDKIAAGIVLGKWNTRHEPTCKAVWESETDRMGEVDEYQVCGACAAYLFGPYCSNCGLKAVKEDG